MPPNAVRLLLAAVLPLGPKNGAPKPLKKLMPPTAGSSALISSPPVTAMIGGKVSRISSGVGPPWRPRPPAQGRLAAGMTKSVRPASQMASEPSMLTV
jgi:hypothetical protein